MKVLVCASVKFRGKIAATMSALEKLGITPLFPNLDLEVGNTDQALDAAHKLRLAMEHYEAAEQADAAYFILPEGYMGTSVKIELGYCLAQKIPVCFSESTGDTDIDCYAAAIIPIDKLDQIKEAYEAL
ncbi:MAG: hypothetical protein WCO52_01840 [bacterium]